MTKILITAYAVNPYKGSEDGSGWNFISQAARYNNVIAITRKNNRPAIEKFIKEHPREHFKNLTFYYFDLPYWLRFWKRKNKGALLYFYLWQLAIIRFIKKQSFNYDIVHNLNFHNDWTPTFLFKLNAPLVWGPMEHHPPIPKQFIKPVYGNKAWVKDRLANLIKDTMRKYNPAMKKGLRKTSVAIAGHSGVINKLPIKPKKIVEMSLVGVEPHIINNHLSKSKFTFISVGRFVPLKGFDVTIKSFALFAKKLSDKDRKEVRLILVGKGPLKSYLENLIYQQGVLGLVEIIEWIPMNELMKLYQRSHVFLFPSHEGAGMVVVEALSYGLPVVCFDNNGPGELVNDNCAFRVPYMQYDKTIKEFAQYLRILFSDKHLYAKMSKEALKTVKNKYIWDVKGNMLDSIYRQAIEQNDK